MSLFKLKGTLSRNQAIILGIAGFIIFLLAWWLLAEVFAVTRSEQAEVPQAFLENNTTDAPVEVAPLIDIDERENSVSEGASIGTYTYLQLGLEPPRDSGEVLYRFAASIPSPFTLHPLSGKVTVQDSSRLDYETLTTHALDIVAEKEGQILARGNFMLKVKDVNEFEISDLEDVDKAPNEVRKGQKAGSRTGIIAFAEDLDGSDQVRYALQENPKELFFLDPGTGELLLARDVPEDLPATELSFSIRASSTDGSSTEMDFGVEMLPAAASGQKDEAGEKVYPIIPLPTQVVQAFAPLVSEDELVKNTAKSIWLNFQGYFWAVLISVIFGFIIGLLPLFRGLFSKQVNALRYLPLTAVTGLFIIWFGIEDTMKISFLAFGIIVYLLPVVVQRIDEVERVYTQTVFTLGANAWQTIRTVYFPSVMSKLIDDIRVLTAISWTYIIIAELLNRQGGIGALIYIKARQGQIPKVFALLAIIIIIGFLQDRLFVYLDKRLFPHKYYKITLPGIREVEYGILSVLAMVTLIIFQQIWLPPISSWFITLALMIIIASVVIIGYGEIRVTSAIRKNR